MLPLLRASITRPLVVFADSATRVPHGRPEGAGVDLTLPQFRGIVARKGTPSDRVQALAEAFRKAMETSQWKAFAQASHMAPDSYLGPARFEAWVAAEAETLDRLVRELGLRK